MSYSQTQNIIQLERRKRTRPSPPAIDAAVSGATDTGLLRKFPNLPRNEDEGHVVAEAEPPFSEFRSGIKSILENIVPSQKLDHGSFKMGKQQASA